MCKTCQKLLLSPMPCHDTHKSGTNYPSRKQKNHHGLRQFFLNSSSNSCFSCSNSLRQLRLSPRLVRCQGFSGLSPRKTFSRILVLLGSMSTPVGRILLISPGCMLLHNSPIRSTKVSWDQMNGKPVGNTDFHRGASFEPRTQSHASAKSASSHWSFQGAD